MSIGNYIHVCSGLAGELANSLTKGDVDGLRAELRDLPEGEWLAWLSDNREEIGRFLAATPAERRKRRGWAEPSLRRQLVLGAIHMCECAQAVLEAADRLQPGDSYRETARTAGLHFWKILAANGRNLWPFDEPSPFR